MQSQSHHVRPVCRICKTDLRAYGYEFLMVLNSPRDNTAYIGSLELEKSIKESLKHVAHPQCLSDGPAFAKNLIESGNVVHPWMFSGNNASDGLCSICWIDLRDHGIHVAERHSCEDGSTLINVHSGCVTHGPRFADIIRSTRKPIMPNVLKGLEKSNSSACLRRGRSFLLESEFFMYDYILMAMDMKEMREREKKPECAEEEEDEEVRFALSKMILGPSRSDEDGVNDKEWAMH